MGIDVKKALFSYFNTNYPSRIAPDLISDVATLIREKEGREVRRDFIPKVMRGQKASNMILKYVYEIVKRDKMEAEEFLQYRNNNP